jgi:predicted  nucleic acid-binding Zn-ribbon protein
MRHFSVILLVLCMLLPPVLYLATVVVLEQQVQDRFTREIEDVSTGDPQALLEGSVRLRDVLRTNIDAFLRASALLRYGMSARVSVTTRGGAVLYPYPYDEDPGVPSPANPTAVARENFAFLSEGLVVQVDVILEHNRLLSNAVLGLYVGAALVVLLLHYRAAGRRIGREETERRGEVDRLQQLQRANTDRLAELQSNRETLEQELGGLRSSLHDERSRAERNEDDLIAEIESLETRLEENLRHQEIQQQEIASLKENLTGNEKEQRREDRSRQKTETVLRKRFATLYKNIAVNDRAIEGLVDLNDELRLKAEEIVHQLNSNPDLVPVKRKVFGKKNRETVLEVVFAYKGRLYFRRGMDRRVEVLAVGTKNSQERELEFLSNL